MYRVYKSQTIDFGETKHIEHIDKWKARSKKKEDKDAINITTDLSREEKAKDIIDLSKKIYKDTIEEAKVEAQRIIEEVKEDAQEERKKIIQEAHEEGFEKGYLQGKARAESIIEEAKNLKLFLENRKLQLLKEAEEDVIDMILSIAKKVLEQELVQNDDVIISLVRQAINKSAYKNKVSIKVSQEDYEYVKANKSLIESLIEGLAEVLIIKDESLKKGDCIVDTPAGQVNSGIEYQMKELEKAFLFVLRNE